MNFTSLDQSSLPEHLDINEISKALARQNKGGVSENAFVPCKLHTVSDQKFGSLWNFKQHGIVLANTFSNYPGQDGTQHTLSAEGPAIRILGCVPGLSQSERQKSQNTTRLKMFKDQAQNSLKSIDSFIVTENCARYRFKQFFADEWQLFRLGPPKNELDDESLIDKMEDFNQFAMNKQNNDFMVQVHKGVTRPIEKIPELPTFLSDIPIPPRQTPDGSALPELSSEEIAMVPKEFVPEIARSHLTHCVIAIMTTPTLLNCVDESHLLKERVDESPVGKDEYDEAIAVLVSRPFNSEDKAIEFKENFAKHSLPHCRMYVVPLYKRIPLLDIFTKWHEETVPMSYHEEEMHKGIVERQEQEQVKRDLAESQGMDIVHFGLEQTKEEADYQVEKLKGIGLARQCAVELEEELRQYYVALNKQLATQSDELKKGGGGSKD